MAKAKVGEILPEEENNSLIPVESQVAIKSYTDSAIAMFDETIKHFQANVEVVQNMEMNDEAGLIMGTAKTTELDKMLKAAEKSKLAITKPMRDNVKYINDYVSSKINDLVEPVLLKARQRLSVLSTKIQQDKDAAAQAARQEAAANTNRIALHQSNIKNYLETCLQEIKDANGFEMIADAKKWDLVTKFYPARISKYMGKNAEGKAIVNEQVVTELFEEFADDFKAALSTVMLAAKEKLAFLKANDAIPVEQQAAKAEAFTAAAETKIEAAKEAIATNIETKAEEVVAEGNKAALAATLEAKEKVGPSKTKTWEFEVLDETIIPRHMMSPDPVKIREWIKNIANKHPDPALHLKDGEERFGMKFHLREGVRLG